MLSKAFIALGAGASALVLTGVASASWSDLSGPKGATGATGKIGVAGTTGTAGRQGHVGDTGASGAWGAAGAQGRTGDTGAAGATGLRGLKGAAGADGTDGAPGPQGLKGDTGAAGAMGLQGLTGAAGAPGVDGAPGPQGLKGDTGATGPQGLAGPGSVGSVYAVSASGAQGGYLQLSNANADFSLFLTCNYGGAGDNETLWFANQSSRSASVLETFIGGGVGGVYAFPTVPYGQGGTDRTNPTSWPYQATFTINEAGVLTRWDVTATGSSGGPCTYTVYQNGTGSAFVHQM